MRKQWTEETVRAEASAVARLLGHFPTNTYLRDTGRNDLASQITKAGGYVKLAAELGFARQHSDTDTGWQGEREVAEKLKRLGHEVTKPSGVKSPYDLLVDGAVRVDVKAANYAEYGPCRGWFYRIGKHVQADVIILHQLDRQGDYVFHWWEVTTTNMTIARDGGKYRAALGAYSKIEYVRNAVRELAAI